MWHHQIIESLLFLILFKTFNINFDGAALSCVKWQLCFCNFENKNGILIALFQTLFVQMIRYSFLCCATKNRKTNRVNWCNHLFSRFFTCFAISLSIMPSVIHWHKTMCIENDGRSFSGRKSSDRIVLNVLFMTWTRWFARASA